MGKFKRAIAIPALVTIFGLGAIDSVDDLQNHDMNVRSNSSIQYEVSYERGGGEFVANAYVFTQDREEVFTATVVEVHDVMGQVLKREREELEEEVRLEPGIPFYMRFSFDDCRDCRSVRIFFITDSQRVKCSD